MDMRQKLFPIFLQEATRKLAVLRSFLHAENGSGDLKVLLEDAFRAAHTLKGTSHLVQVESIHKISKRLERLLEKHLRAASRPTQVEYEAIQLAVDWIAQLLEALQQGQPGAKMLADDAVIALDMAEKFPGKTPLIELLESAEQQRSPQLDDPFDSDPVVSVDEAALVRQARDPFADDPGFGMEFDCINGATLSLKEEAIATAGLLDPFLEDSGFELTEPGADTVAPSSAAKPALSLPLDALPVKKNFDPFAGDPLYHGDEQLDPVGSSESAPASLDAEPDAAVESAPAESESTTGGSKPVADREPLQDPFAEDGDFLEPLTAAAPEVAGPAGGTTAAPTGREPVAKELPVDSRAQEIAESLLLPRDADSVPQRHYACCSFVISGRRYDLPIAYMVEIYDFRHLLPLPLAPPMVTGLVNMRGQVIPVIDLAVLHQHQQAGQEKQRLVIAEFQGERIAFLADGIPSLAEDFRGERLDLPEFLKLYRLKGPQG